MSQNMRLRIISASLMISLLMIVIFRLPNLVDFILVGIAVLMLIEWFQMTSTSLTHLLVGLLIIPVPIISLCFLHRIDHSGYYLFTYLTLICSVDSFAMLGGRRFGGPKLCPNISPNKTWSGLICGIVGSNAMLYLLSYMPGYLLPIKTSLSIVQKILLISAFCVLEQISDLFISMFKRKFKIKDSGNLIPGHGGVLDRLDGIILTAPVFLFMIFYL